MQAIQIDHTEASRLRFVFADKVVSVGIAKNATMGEIARKFASLERKYRRKPVAVDVTLSAAFHAARS